MNMNTPRTLRKLCVVTGATSGIGKATAFGLARQGVTVVLVCRDRVQGEAAAREIKEKTGNSYIDVGIADLSSQSSIRQFATWYANTYDRLDVLINNAGAIFDQREITEDGVEATFAVNHLAPFLLTNLLLDILKRSAPSRVITVASRAEQRGAIDFDDLSGEKHYDGWKAYCRSKLANILFTYELARRLEGTGVTANCVYPGMVASNFGKNSSHMKLPLTLLRPFMISPEEGAKTSLYLALSPEMEGVTGKYFFKNKPIQSSPHSYDRETARKLWQVSEEMTRLV